MVAAELKIYRNEGESQLSATPASIGVAAGQSAPAQASTNVQGAIVYQSAPMCQAVEQARRFARSSATILLNGESGTGKEMFASLIHTCSNRSQQVFARVNCAALSETLIESELFGHERGAFTGADDARTGRFEWADGGTLLLDEISEVPLSIQAKLLRVLEENEIQRVGCNRTRQVDVRIIATSNRDLQAEVAANRFRGDLYHRLNVLQIAIPSLRNRSEDIPLLAERFVKFFGTDAQTQLTGIDLEAMDLLSGYDWPGNVRELRNTIHRACVLANGTTIGVSDLPVLQLPDAGFPPWMLEETLGEIERRVILESLKKFNWNKTQAAQQLGVTARTLSNKLRTYDNQRQVPKAA